MRAYSRANLSRDILLMILRRYCALIRSERIDILYTATASVGSHFQGGVVRPPPVPGLNRPIKGGIYILSKLLGFT